MTGVNKRPQTGSDRRTFLKSTAVAALGTTALAGCLGGSDDDSGGDSPEIDGEVEDQLNIFQWGDYWPDGTVQTFEEEHGVDVSVSNFASNEEMFNALKAGGTDQYDLIFPSDYMISILAEQEMIQPLHLEHIPNYENLAEMFTRPPYDPGEDVYAAPYQWGTSGIGYNTNVIGEADISSWEAMWNEEWAGQMTMLDDMRETIGATLKYLGYSLNTTDESEIEEAKELLIQQKDLLMNYDSTNFTENLVNEQASPVHGWSGEVLAAYWETLEDGESPVNYAVPDEGGVVWVDNGAVTAEARNPNAAHAFINYFLDAEVAASITNWTYFGSPNEAAEEHIDDAVLENEAIYPSEETMDRLEFIENVGEATTLYDDAWTEIQNA